MKKKDIRIIAVVLIFLLTSDYIYMCCYSRPANREKRLLTMANQMIENGIWDEARIYLAL